jgi:hypothetical protein
MGARGDLEAALGDFVSIADDPVAGEFSLFAVATS